MFKIKKLRYQYNQIDTAKILLDKNLIILSINNRAINILGLKNEIVGTNILLHLSANIRGYVLSKVKILFNNKNEQINNREHSKKNKKINYKIKIKTLFSTRYTLKGICLYVKSIKQNTKSPNSFPKHINNLSHDLRAPLSNIKSFLETLYEYNEELSTKQKLEFLERATNETNRLNNLVTNILNLAQIKRNKEKEENNFLINEIIEEIINLNQIILINKKLLLTKSVNYKNHISVKKVVLFRRILSNLLNNSIKFTYPTGLINIQIKTLHSLNIMKLVYKSNFRFSLLDTGIGIAKQDKKNIFKSFERGDSVNNCVLGSGLGLAIVKESLNKENEGFNFFTRNNNGSSASFNFNSFCSSFY